YGNITSNIGTDKGLKFSTGADNGVFDSCIITLNGRGEAIVVEAGALTVKNCALSGDTGNNGVHIGTDITNIYNTIIQGFNDGVKTSAGATANSTNCAVFDSGNDFDIAVGTQNIDFCASDDGDGTNSVDISPGGTEADDWNNAFTDYANGDFSVKDTSSVLYNAGTDLSGSGVTDDIIDTARPQPGGGSYDIGAFELVQAAAGGIVILRRRIEGK
ncbi:hypothetical protein LCGC14_3028370, partial [marine sediment metagenome]